MARERATPLSRVGFSHSSSVQQPRPWAASPSVWVESANWGGRGKSPPQWGASLPGNSGRTSGLGLSAPGGPHADGLHQTGGRPSFRTCPSGQVHTRPGCHRVPPEKEARARVTLGRRSEAGWGHRGAAGGSRDPGPCAQQAGQRHLVLSCQKPGRYTSLPQSCDKCEFLQTPPNVLWWQNWPLSLLRTIDLGQTLASASGETEAQGDQVIWRNPTPDVHRQPLPATRPCLLQRPLQVHSDVTWTGLIFSHFLRPQNRSDFHPCEHM